MTSGEILDIIYKTAEAGSVQHNLKQILQIADLVKFAKLHPLPEENDMSLINAYLFVNQTKVEELSLPEKDQENEEDKGLTVNEDVK